VTLSPPLGPIGLYLTTLYLGQNGRVLVGLNLVLLFTAAKDRLEAVL